MFLLVIYCIFNSVYMSIPIPQFIPPTSFPPLVARSCFFFFFSHICDSISKIIILSEGSQTRQISYDIAYVQKLNNGTNELIFKIVLYHGTLTVAPKRFRTVQDSCVSQRFLSYGLMIQLLEAAVENVFLLKISTLKSSKLFTFLLN